jgi:hypothetical protein
VQLATLDVDPEQPLAGGIPARPFRQDERIGDQEVYIHA